MSLFGGSRKKKSTLAGRVKKLETKLAKKNKIKALKAREASLRKSLYGR